MLRKDGIEKVCRTETSGVVHNSTRRKYVRSDSIKSNEAVGIETTNTTGDADGTIVKCGLYRAAVHPAIAIVGQDVDLIVFLIGLAPPSINMNYMKPGRGKVEIKLILLRKLQQLP
ncbi:hypothetical protein JTB14_017574 [Gonioctena quinquepunctata]|nr:hypothetical protein JTB14_017574 [Gonioctena quinquepunctata]